MRRLLPRRLISAARLLVIFQNGHGHVRRRDGFPVNGKGDYQPWLTYPAIEYLIGLDFSGLRVFEFGAGASTLFWAERAREVVSVEFDANWYSALLSRIPENVSLLHENHGERYANSIRHCKGHFDVVVVDGAERYRSAEAALSKLAPGGMIILDNAEWYPNTADMLEAAGLIEVRFSGFSPINAFTSTTSLFLSPDFAMPRNRISRAVPVGGTALPHGVLDDGLSSAR